MAKFDVNENSIELPDFITADQLKTILTTFGKQLEGQIGNQVNTILQSALPKQSDDKPDPNDFKSSTDDSSSQVAQLQQQLEALQKEQSFNQRKDQLAAKLTEYGYDSSAVTPYLMNILGDNLQVTPAGMVVKNGHLSQALNEYLTQWSTTDPVGKAFAPKPKDNPGTGDSTAADGSGKKDGKPDLFGAFSALIQS